MTIGQALSAYWKKERDAGQKMVALLSFLEFNYKTRYIDLCARCQIEPVSFPNWLLRDISTI